MMRTSSRVTHDSDCGLCFCWLLDPWADQISHDGCCLVLGCGDGVGVGGQGEARAAVAQHGGDGFYIDAVLQGQRCEGVAEIAKADMLQPGFF
jgi:hypothetical protein